MSDKQQVESYDYIIIGSGTCGATLAKKLGEQGKRVLVLERGNDKPLKETFTGFASVADQVSIGKKFNTARAITMGGSTAMYFGVAMLPDTNAFKQIGLDITAAVTEAQSLLPLAELPDDLITPQAMRLAEAAQSCGLDWQKHKMLIDQSKCTQGYAYEAKWKARSFMADAIESGIDLQCNAEVKQIVVHDGIATGVRYIRKTGLLSKEICEVSGGTILVCAGELASPKLIKDAGVESIGAQGFFADPGYALYGLVPDLHGTEGFVGSMGCQYEEGIEIGDANVGRLLHRLMMIGSFKPKHLFSFSNTIGVGVKVKDSMGGEYREDGSFNKTPSQEDFKKLKKGEQKAREVLAKAGARDIFNVGLNCAGHVGGLIRFNEHVNTEFETKIRNLHVCDGSLLPDNMRITPTFTLVTLALHLSKILLSRNESDSEQSESYQRSDSQTEETKNTHTEELLTPA